MITRTELNDLRTQLQEMEDELLIAKEDVKEKQRNISILAGKVKSLQERIQNEGEDSLIVSEHAIVRYFERILGFDINQIINDIKSSDLVRSADIGGVRNAKIKTKNGYNVVIKNGCIVTISV